MIKQDNSLHLICGKQHRDERGCITFFNELDFSAVKRFYKIEHPSIKIVRAWQGHKKEQKWFFVTSGAFKVVIVKPDSWEVPSEDLLLSEFALSAGSNEILHVPGGFINGFQALEPESTIMIFSDFTTEESQSDDFRFDKGLWYKW